MKITKSDIKILLELYKSANGLTPYHFYQRFKFGPAEVYKSVTKFSQKNFLEIDKDNIRITKLGKEYVEKNRFSFRTDKFDRIPDKFLDNKIDI